MSENTGDTPSTLKACMDAATGAVQHAIGHMTGDSSKEEHGKEKQRMARSEYEESHAVTRLRGTTSSSTGAIAEDHPDRPEGSWKQTAGTAKQFIGNLVGDENLKQAGREQDMSGRAQETRGQIRDFASGLGDRVIGALGSAAADLTGNKEKQAKFKERHDVGKTRERGAEVGLQKKFEDGKQVTES